MNQSLIKNFLLLAFFSIETVVLFAQRVYPLVPGIVVDSILSTKPGATKIAMEPISGHLFYATINEAVQKGQPLFFIIQPEQRRGN